MKSTNERRAPYWQPERLVHEKTRARLYEQLRRLDPTTFMAWRGPQARARLTFGHPDKAVLIRAGQGCVWVTVPDRREPVFLPVRKRNNRAARTVLGLAQAAFDRDSTRRAEEQRVRDELARVEAIKASVRETFDTACAPYQRPEGLTLEPNLDGTADVTLRLPKVTPAIVAAVLRVLNFVGVVGRTRDTPPTP